ncbi:MAG: hypothetical protein R3F14_11595 [Polyangiaceae bacterium]
MGDPRHPRQRRRPGNNIRTSGTDQYGAGSPGDDPALPSRALGTADEVAHVIVFLASDADFP